MTARGSRIIPSLRYRNAPAAIDWLCKVLGFQRLLVVPMPDGKIAHAQVTLKGGMIMLGSVMETPFGKYMRQPDEVGNVETTSVCVVVDDADAVDARAREAGAEILMPCTDQEYGGRGLAFRDLEGHIWWAGTYDPWATE